MKCIIQYLKKIFKRRNKKHKTWKDIETQEHQGVVDLYRRYVDLKD